MKVLRYGIAGVLFAITTIVLATPPDYTGRSRLGAVYINADRTTMRGSFGVRFRPVSQHTYSYIKTTFDSWTITFQGYDSSTGRPFYCYTFNGRTRDYPWDNFLDMAVNAGNGTLIEVSRYGDAEPNFRNVCKSVRIEHSSEDTH